MSSPELQSRETLSFPDGDLVLAVDADMSAGSVIIAFSEKITLFHSGDLRKTVSGVYMLGGRYIGKKLPTRLEFVSSVLFMAEALDYKPSERRERVEGVTMKMSMGRSGSVTNAPTPWQLDGTLIRDANGKAIFNAIGASLPIDLAPRQDRAPGLIEVYFPSVAKLFKR